MELRRYLQPAQPVRDLSGEPRLLKAFLRAVRIFPLGAMIVNIAVDVSVLLMFYFLLGGDEATALAAAHHAGKCKDVALGARLAFSAEDNLHLIVFFGGDHRLMDALVPVAASSWVLKRSVVDRAGEETIDSATARRFALPRLEFPLVFCNSPYPYRRMMTSKHEVKHLPDHIKSFRVSDNDFVSFLGVGIIQIAQWRYGRKDTALRFLMEAALHIVAEISDVLIRHAELKIGEKRVILRPIIFLRRLDILDFFSLEHADNHAGFIGVSRKAIQFPA